MDTEEEESMETDCAPETGKKCEGGPHSAQQSVHSTQTMNTSQSLPESECTRGIVLNQAIQGAMYKCHSCGSNWVKNKYSTSCSECDGFALTRPCAICRGGCGNTWQRNVDQSNRTGRASWIGLCDNQRQARLRIDLLHMHQITDAMEMLNTGRT